MNDWIGNFCGMAEFKVLFECPTTSSFCGKDTHLGVISDMKVPRLYFYFPSRAIQFQPFSAISAKWNIPLWRAIKMTPATKFLLFSSLYWCSECLLVCVCLSVSGENNCIILGACAFGSRGNWTSYFNHFGWSANLIVFLSCSY